MAFVIEQHGKWCVDFTTPEGKRQRRVVGDGTDRDAARKECKLIDRELKQIRESRRVPNLADVDYVIEACFKACVTPLSPRTRERGGTEPTRCHPSR